MEVTLLSQNTSHDAYGVLIDRWAHGYPEDCIDTILKYAANNLWKD